MVFSAVLKFTGQQYFRKTAFTSSPFPCNLLILSELWVKASFFVVLFQLSDLQCFSGEGFASPFPSPFVHLVFLLPDLSISSPPSSHAVVAKSLRFV